MLRDACCPSLILSSYVAVEGVRGREEERKEAAKQSTISEIPKPEPRIVRFRLSLALPR